MAVATKSYNPGFLTPAELEDLFCVRVAEFDSLIETLRENTGNSNQHAIVIGPRGSGKTTLLLRVALEVRSNPELSSRLFPIVFGEESYGVSTCGEFWLECLSRLSEQVPQRDGEPDLRRTLEDVRRERDDRLLRERCLGAVLGFADREGKRLVLGVENLNMMFSDMMDRDAGWCLRKTLQTEPRIMMIGSATSRFGEIDRPDRALYDLFRVLQLRPLDRRESAVLCEKVSGRPLEAGAVRRLQILTGGSPRLLAIMARFASERSFHTLMSDLLGLVDEHTAYFKSHLESLPAQERRVYLALAALWKPATAREVAERARTETSKCSAQLKRLMGRGVVEVAGGTSRRKQYYVSERLYNVYYLLRRSRGTDGLVSALVEFMDAYYSAPEFEKLVDQMVADASVADSRTRPIYQSAFEQLNRLPIPAWHLFFRHPDHVPDSMKGTTWEAMNLLDEGSAHLERGDLDQALEALEALLRRFKADDSGTVQDVSARALVMKGRILVGLERYAEAIMVFDRVNERLGTTTSRRLLNVLSEALTLRAACLGRLGKLPNAIDACDEVILRLESINSHELDPAVAIALCTREMIQEVMDRPDEQLDTCDEIDRRFGSSENPVLLVAVAIALEAKARALFRLHRWEESIAVCEAIQSRFGEYKSGDFLEWIAKALIVKSRALYLLGRTNEQLAACDEVLRRLDGRDKCAAPAGPAGPSERTALSLRLQSHTMRMVAGAAERDDPASIVRDVKAVLDMLPQVEDESRMVIAALIECSPAVGFDQLASLIRKSPSAEPLLALTIALEMETGLQPRVSIEVQKVAEDIRLDLARLRKRNENG